MLGDLLGGGDSKVTKQPWKPLQKPLKEVIPDITENYNQGEQPYPNIPALAPLNPWTQQGMNLLIDPGNVQQMQKLTGDVSRGYRQDRQGYDVYSNPGALNGAWGAIDQSTGNASNPMNDYLRYLQQAGRYSGQLPNYSAGTAGVDNAPALQSILAGINDPALQQYIEQSNQDIMDSIMQNNLMPQEVAALASGGYGGSASQNIRRGAGLDYANAAAKNRNALILDMQGKQLSAADIIRATQGQAQQAELSRLGAQMQMAGQMGDYSLSSTGQGLEGARLAFGVNETGDRLNLANLTQQGAFLPVMDQMNRSYQEDLLRAGNFYDTRAQAERDDEIMRALYNQNLDDAALDEYLNRMLGLNGVGGTTTQPSGSGGLSGILGAGTSALGIIGGTGGLAEGGWATGASGAAGAMGPYGWAAMAAAGLLGSGVL